jgi:hypothetical protein
MDFIMRKYVNVDEALVLHQWKPEEWAVHLRIDRGKHSQADPPYELYHGTYYRSLLDAIEGFVRRSALYSDISIAGMASGFNIKDPDLEKQFKSIKLTWKHIEQFLKKHGISKRKFASIFLGGVISEHTIGKGIKLGKELSKAHKFILLSCLLHRQEYLSSIMLFKNKEENYDG